MYKKIALGVSLLAIVAGACTSPDSAKPDTIVAPTKSAAVQQSTGPASADPKAAFHASNGADWVGRAHNKNLDEIFADLISRKVNKNVCAEIERLASQASRIPNGQDQRNQGERTAAARRGLMASGICDADYSLVRNGATADESQIQLTNFIVSDVSPAAQALLDNIKSAARSASSSSALAANLNGIIAQAPNLPGLESEIVYAVASVAQSSFEYWEVNASVLANQVNVTYGSCLAQYSVEATALQNCMGISGPPVLPTQFENDGSTGYMTFAAAGPKCTYPVGDVIEGDVIGGVMGAIGGALTGQPGAALLGGVLGGLGTSSVMGWWKVGRYIYCFARNGGGGTPPVEGT